MIFNKRVVAMACADLDAMRSGTLHLSVPLVNGVIQIGIGGNPDTGTLQVTKTPTSLRVCRVDGEPMQAELLTWGTQTDGPVLRTTVFEQPVDRLVLEREAALWVSTATIHAGRHRSVEQFIRTVATFGVTKQRRFDGVPLR